MERGVEPRWRSAALKLFLLLALLPLAAQGQMYKCVDARGVMQYSDKPCPGGKEVDIRGQPPISGKLTPAKEDLKRDEREFQRRQIQQERQEQAEAKKLAQAKQRCDNLRNELARASAVRRPPNAEQHEARLKRLNEEITAKCG